MPWSPTFRGLPDARLDPYRNRCAALYRAGALVGHVLVLTEYFATQRGGHLWWRRFEPDLEYAQPLVQMRDGSESDQPIHGEDLDEELEHWSRGKSPLLGELLDMAWLTREEALRVAPEVFGACYCFDNDDSVIWSFEDDPGQRRTPRPN